MCSFFVNHTSFYEEAPKLLDVLLSSHNFITFYNPIAVIYILLNARVILGEQIQKDECANFRFTVSQNLLT